MKYHEPETWGNMLRVEQRMIDAMKADDLSALKTALSEYRILMVDFCGRIPKEEPEGQSESCHPARRNEGR